MWCTKANLIKSNLSKKDTSSSVVSTISTLLPPSSQGWSIKSLYVRPQCILAGFFGGLCGMKQFPYHDIAVRQTHTNMVDRAEHTSLLSKTKASMKQRQNTISIIFPIPLTMPVKANLNSTTIGKYQHCDNLWLFKQRDINEIFLLGLRMISIIPSNN